MLRDVNKNKITVQLYCAKSDLYNPNRGHVESLILHGLCYVPGKKFCTQFIFKHKLLSGVKYNENQLNGEILCAV